MDRLRRRMTIKVTDNSGLSLMRRLPEKEEERRSLFGPKLEEYARFLCRVKADEFRLYGYERITGEQIWSYIAKDYQEAGYPRLHRLANDILSLKPDRFMDWLRLSVYRDASPAHGREACRR